MKAGYRIHAEGRSYLCLGWEKLYSLLSCDLAIARLKEASSLWENVRKEEKWWRMAAMKMTRRRGACRNYGKNLKNTERRSGGGVARISAGRWRTSMKPSPLFSGDVIGVAAANRKAKAGEENDGRKYRNGAASRRKCNENLLQAIAINHHYEKRSAKARENFCAQRLL